jgi:hypothetical protein
MSQAAESSPVYLLGGVILGSNFLLLRLTEALQLTAHRFLGRHKVVALLGRRHHHILLRRDSGRRHVHRAVAEIVAGAFLLIHLGRRSVVVEQDHARTGRLLSI